MRPMTFSTPLTTRRKPYGGMQMEGALATWYAQITRDRRDHRKTAQAIAAQLPAGSAVLEVAPGPGYMAVELARLGGYRITGLDISHSFVRIATDNARRAGVSIEPGLIPNIATTCASSRWDCERWASRAATWSACNRRLAPNSTWRTWP